MDIRFSKQALTLQPSEIRNKLFDDPDIISFAAGKPESAFFPLDEAKAALHTVLEKHGEIAFQYSDTEGFFELRQLIAKERMAQAGVTCAADEIALISGAQQGIEFSAKIFVNEGDVIICENPTYTGALIAFQPYRPKIVGVSMDDEGMIMEELEDTLKKYPNAKMIYTIPDFQNPTGVSMSVERRKKLAQLAATYQIPVIEDCPYGDITYNGVRLPSVKSFDREGWVVYLGSFSKVFFPGLRLGWVCASQPMLEKYILTKQSSDLQCSSLNEMIAISYMKTFNLAEHIARLRAEYHNRRNVMIECINEYFPKEIKHTTPNGGFFIWLELKKEIDGSELLMEAARKKKVAFVPGAPFFTTSGQTNYIRLSYSSVNTKQIKEGMKRLGELLHEYY